MEINQFFLSKVFFNLFMCSKSMNGQPFNSLTGSYSATCKIMTTFNAFTYVYVKLAHLDEQLSTFTNYGE